MRALQILAGFSSGSSPSEIARRVGCDRPNVYQYMDRLTAKGYLKAETRELTAKGRQALAGAVESFRASLERAGMQAP